MPYATAAFATAADGTRLYVEEAGTGTPILFIHELDRKSVV